MVVVACFSEGYVALPILSYGRQSVKKKPSPIRHEHISVRDHTWFPADSTFEALSDHPPLWTGELENGRHITPESAIYFTHPVTRKFGLRGEVWGELTLESTLYLVHIFRKAMNGLPF